MGSPPLRRVSKKGTTPASSTARATPKRYGSGDGRRRFRASSSDPGATKEQTRQRSLRSRGSRPTLNALHFAQIQAGSFDSTCLPSRRVSVHSACRKRLPKALRRKMRPIPQRAEKFDRGRGREGSSAGEPRTGRGTARRLAPAPKSGRRERGRSRLRQCLERLPDPAVLDVNARCDQTQQRSVLQFLGRDAFTGAEARRHPRALGHAGILAERRVSRFALCHRTRAAKDRGRTDFRAHATD